MMDARVDEAHAAARALVAPHDDLEGQAGNFSLVLGGPLYQLLRRAHLSDDALHQARQRVVVITMFAWLPLVLLSALEGRLLPGGVAVPFVYDLEVQVRFLVALPLLILAELVVHQRMRRIAAAFLDRHLVSPANRPRFMHAIASAMRLRNSVAAEVVLLALVYLVGVLIVWRHFVVLKTGTWYVSPADSDSHLTYAGIWYGYVSVPLFQFLLLRWYFRLFIWARFLWQVSRMPLALVPAHPDRLGGLGFLSNTVYAFAVLVVAHGAILSAQLANRILFLGANLLDFKIEIGVWAAFLAILVFGPLLVFGPQLAEAKRTGLREYGAFGERYVRAFAGKWLNGAAPPDEPLLGSADIQSLADLGNSYQVVKEMRYAPITRDAVVQLAAALLLPIAPLALTIMPMEELLKKLVGLIL
jgi:hypothetical protein